MKVFIFILYLCTYQGDCIYQVAPYEFYTLDDCLKFKEYNDKEIQKNFKENNINPNQIRSKCYALDVPNETRISTLPLNRF